MRTAWDGKEVVAPLSLVVSAFAPVEDVRGAAAAAAYRWGHRAPSHRPWPRPQPSRRLDPRAGFLAARGHLPDVEGTRSFKGLFRFVRENRDAILAYHDRSDGGLRRHMRWRSPATAG